jgi:CHAT domain-containing protein
VVKIVLLPEAHPAEAYAISARFREEVVSPEAPLAAALETSGKTVYWLQDKVLKPIEDGASDLLAQIGNLDGDPLLTIVATGPFTGLPFHAAALRDGRLAASLGLAYTPALSVLDSSASSATGETSVLIVADPSAPGSETLQGAIAERQALSALWPKAVEFSSSSATVEAIRAALPNASVIHFACHGRSDDAEPLRSGLLLADGEFTMRDVLSTKLRPGSLVILSACQTAVHDPSVPDEALSLAAGFLAAGAATVVASLWPVPDDPTALLMTEFHKALHQGRQPARALGAAQAAMASGRLKDASGAEDWRAPYYWAGFVALTGVAPADPKLT